jgi:hypothetical protein
MLLTHSFSEEWHEYLVDGYYVLATSSVLSLNGLTNYDGIPTQVLDHAAWRGTETHRAIEYMEDAVRQGEPLESAAKSVWAQLVGELEEIRPFLRGYLKFRKEYEFEPVGDLEKTLVYLHDETAIGCTIDFRGRIHGKGFSGRTMIGDAKTCAKQYGMAKKQKVLAWRLQTQSYWEASMHDQEWLQSCYGENNANESVGRFIVNMNKQGGYEFFDFSQMDDSLSWDSCVHLAALKLANGHKQPEKRVKAPESMSAWAEQFESEFGEIAP